MRYLPLLLAALVIGCQSSPKEGGYSEKPRTCDTRSADSGQCVPGGYDNY